MPWSASSMNTPVSIYLSLGCSRKGSSSVHESPSEPILGRIEQVFLPFSTPDLAAPDPRIVGVAVVARSETRVTIGEEMQ